MFENRTLGGLIFAISLILAGIVGLAGAAIPAIIVNLCLIIIGLLLLVGR